MDIIVTGSIAYDYIMRFPGRFTEHFLTENRYEISLSFLVDDMTRHWGGNGGNISYTLGLLGLRPKLFGTVGQDFGDYGTWLTNAGVDTRLIQQHNDVFCASFFVNTDLENNQIASFYGGAMAKAKEHRIADVYDVKPDIVIISPNDPQAMLNLAEECRSRGIRFVYDPSQQIPRLSGDELLAGLDGAYALTVNAFEAAMIGEKTGLDIDDLRARVEILVVTQGKNGSHIYQGNERVEVPIVPVDEIKDPTGVGDAYRAGLLCGFAYQLPLKLAGEVGALCAAYVLENIGPQEHHFTPTEFVTRFRQHFDDQGMLDELAKVGVRE